jgi:hypothetical protein
VPHPSFLRVRILSMRNPLRHYYGRRDLHFVIFTCYRRCPYKGTRQARDHFVKVGEWHTQIFPRVMLAKYIIRALTVENRTVGAAPFVSKGADFIHAQPFAALLRTT